MHACVGRLSHRLGDDVRPGECHTGCMWAIILFLLAAWIVISILGLIIKGLFWLFVVGAILFFTTTVWGWLKKSSS